MFNVENSVLSKISSEPFDFLTIFSVCLDFALHTCGFRGNKLNEENWMENDLKRLKDVPVKVGKKRKKIDNE
jgi:hypothetical protein